VAANAIDLTTATIVAGDLGISSDATVERVVTAASRLIASYCGRSFERATLTEYPPGYARSLLLLSRPPIVSVTSITEEGNTVSAADYSVTARLDGISVSEAGMVYRLGGGTWLSTVRYEGRITDSPGMSVGTSNTDGITVVYVGGYVTPGQNALDPISYPSITLPEDVQEAAVVVASALYKRRGLDQNLASESLGDWSVSYRGSLPTAIAPEVEAFLAPYVLRRVS
jgi:hypothetical protein